MTRIIQIAALLAALALPALCQNARLTTDDQKEFDKAYTHWVNDTRKNDRDDIAKDVRKMQDIMARNNIPANVPYDQIASSGMGYQPQQYQQQLSPEDQKDFDKAYTKWVNDTRKNDRDDIGKDERKMRDIMQRNNIPPDVPFDRIASTGYGMGPAYNNGYGNNGYNNNGQYANPPQYAPQGTYQRLSQDDQREFDKAYVKWMNDTQRNDRDDIDKDVRKMQDIMTRYEIPPDVPFNQIASPNAAYQH
jgi:hypothetical protein